MTRRSFALPTAVLLLLPIVALAADEWPVDTSANAVIEPGDWPQWGGTSYRNNTPVAANAPDDWDVGDFDRRTGEWIRDGARNIRWVAPVGSQTYGNLVVSGGKVFVGTNNGAGYLERYPRDIDLGCLIAFRESDGQFLWQHSNEKLPTGRVHDWPQQGVCSAPYVEGDRLWYVTNRGEVVCLDTEGFYDGVDDGPVTGEWGTLFEIRNVSGDYEPAAEALRDGELNDHLREMFSERGMPLPDKFTMTEVESGRMWHIRAEVHGNDRDMHIELTSPRITASKIITADDLHEADVVWRFDMMTELGVSQHNMASCSITALGDILFINTSNGVDESHLHIPAPEAPSFIAMNKHTGELYWTDNSPGMNILHGQWSSPTVARLGGVDQVLFAAGDGWLYSFKADQGVDGSPELLWKFDCNPKQSRYILGGRGTRNYIVGVPVVYDGLVYIAVGQDPEHGEGVGHLWCIHPHNRGDVSPQLAVHVNDRGRSIPHRRIQAVIPEDGEIAIDNPNSAVVWHYSEFDWDGDGEISFEETMHRTIGTAAIQDDLLFIADFSGLFHCVDAKTGEQYWTFDMFAASWSSPLIADGKVYIGDEDGDVHIFRLTKEPHEPINVINMGNAIYTTPIFANGTLFINNRTHVFAIQAAEAAE